MAIREYDVLVIGSGGGTKISTPASQLGKRVAIIEKDRLGGTCLNRGCIPSKMLIHPAEVAHQIDDAGRFFIRAKGYKVDFQALVQSVSAEIDAESDSILPGYRKNQNLDYFHGTASFVAPHMVRVRDHELTAKQIYIASGSRPFVPPIPGLEAVPYMTSTEALRLEKQPRRLIVLGGGYIACELAFYFAALGTEVSMIARSTLVRGQDHQVRDHFQECFARRLKVYLHHSTQRVTHDGSCFRLDVSAQSGKEFSLEAEALLVATGIVPNSDMLNLDAAGVATDGRGFIKVDNRLRTNVPGIWALGDVVGNYLFRHSVNHEGEYLLHTTIAQQLDEAIDYGAMPHAMFSSPQLAGVGETEEQLKKRNADYVVGYRRYADSAMGMALRSDEGFVKLLVDRSTRRILGCHIIGHEASVLIHQVITLMQMKGSLDDLLSTIFIHPALNEIVRNAARDAHKKLANSEP